MNFLERIPAKISQSTLPVIIMKFDDEVWLKTSFSPDIFNDMRDINTASFHKNNEAAAMVLSEFKNKIDLHTKGLPKGIRNEVREESNRIQKAIKKLNGNVWKLSEDDLADALKTVAHFHTGIIVDVRDSFASLHSLVHNLAIEKSKAEFKLPNQERKEELNNRIAKLSSAPSSIKLCLENEPCRIYGAGFENNMVKVKAKYNDGVWDKLKKDIGWSYSDGELFTDDPDKIIEGLTYIDANNYEYTAAINVFENLDNFKERQLMFQAKRKREAEKLEKNKQKAQEKIIEKTQNLKYPLDLAVYDSELGDPGIGYIFKSGDSYNVKMKFGDGVYDELKKLGWIYKGNSIMAIGSNNAPNIESIYDGINIIDGLSDYKIELGALLEFQDICDKALEIKKQKEKDLEQSRAVKIDKDFPAPDGLNYMDYQKAGIEYALQRNSVLIADEMGLGKTIQAIGLINADKEINNALVVCPASLKLNWRNECKKWLVRDLSIGVADGKNFPTTDIVIINYDILQKHHDNIRSFTWDLMVTDEFQCLKNQASLRTIEVAGGQNIKPINTKDKLFSYIDRCLLNVKDSQFAGQVEEIKNNVNELKDKTDPKNFNVDPEIIKLREKVGNLLLQQDQNTNQYFDFNKVAKNLKKTPIPAKQKCGLSGTPFENKPKEVWSVLNYFDPNNWNNFFTFAKEYCNATQNEYGWNFDGASNLEKLQRKLRTSMMIRRKKSDVLSELPPKQRQVIELPSDGIKKEINAENKIFDQQQKILAELKARVEIARISENNEEYAKALQKYNDAQRFAFNEISKVKKQTGIKKVPLVVEHIKDILENNEKVVCFAHHHEVIEKIKKEFGDDAVTLYGVQSKESRQSAIEKFQNDPDCKVFIGSIRAAGVGITLTAANKTVFAEMDFNPQMLIQAEDREHRIGQKNQVLIQYLVLENSIDSRMMEIIVDKMNKFDMAFNANVDNETISSLKQGSLRVYQPDGKKNIDITATDVVDKSGTYFASPDISNNNGDFVRSDNILDSEEEGINNKSKTGLQDETGEPKNKTNVNPGVPIVSNSKASVDPDVPIVSTSISNKTVQELKEKAELIDKKYYPYIHNALSMVAQACDGAREYDVMGFNKGDAYIGRYLASLDELTPAQAYAGLEIVTKYKKQIPEDTYEMLLEAENNINEAQNDYSMNIS